MLYGKWKPLLGLSILSVVIVTAVFLVTSVWGSAPKGGVPHTPPKRSTHAVNSQITCADSSVIFCMSSNGSSVVSIPFSALRQRGFSGGSSYTYYALLGTQWVYLIGETDYDWSTAVNWVKDTARKMRRSFSMSKTRDSWMTVFGRYKSLVSSLLISLAVFASILTLCGCCCIPCLRSLANRLITTAIEGKNPSHQLMPLLHVSSDLTDDEERADLPIYQVN